MNVCDYENKDSGCRQDASDHPRHQCRDTWLRRTEIGSRRLVCDRGARSQGQACDTRQHSGVSWCEGLKVTIEGCPVDVGV